jgi:hypothetical protein
LREPNSLYVPHTSYYFRKIEPQQEDEVCIVKENKDTWECEDTSGSVVIVARPEKVYRCFVEISYVCKFGKLAVITFVDKQLSILTRILGSSHSTSVNRNFS